MTWPQVYLWMDAIQYGECREEWYMPPEPRDKYPNEDPDVAEYLVFLDTQLAMGAITGAERGTKEQAYRAKMEIEKRRDPD